VSRGECGGKNQENWKYGIVKRPAENAYCRVTRANLWEDRRQAGRPSVQRRYRGRWRRALARGRPRARDPGRGLILSTSSLLTAFFLLPHSAFFLLSGPERGDQIRRSGPRLWDAPGADGRHR